MPTESITEYINRGAMLLFELNQVKQSTTEVDLVSAMLAGLPTSYSGTVEVLELMQKTNLVQVTVRLMAAEVKIKREETAEVATATALAATSRSFKPGMPAMGPGGQRRYFGCYQPGHIRRHCPNNPHRQPRVPPGRGPPGGDRWRDGPPGAGAPGGLAVVVMCTTAMAAAN